MTKKEATAISDVLGGDPFQMPQGDWIVKIRSDLNRLVVIFDDLICQFANEEDFLDSNPITTFAIY